MLDKYVTQMKLKNLCETLEKIAIVIVDSCSLAAKSVRNIVSTNEQH